jgi:ketosteroid isomerase-like protein
MPGQNLEIVRLAYQALDDSGLDAHLDHFHPDAEYDISSAIGPYAGVYRGRAAIRDFLAEYLESWEYVRMEPKDFIAVGRNHVVVPLHMRMRGRSGVAVEAHPFNVWTLRDGKAERIAVYNEEAQALRAAGRSG